jgi:hypothetical protein
MKCFVILVINGFTGIISNILKNIWMKEAVRTSETSAYYNETIWRNIPEVSTLVNNILVFSYLISISVYIRRVGGGGGRVWDY